MQAARTWRSGSPAGRRDTQRLQPVAHGPLGLQEVDLDLHEVITASTVVAVDSSLATMSVHL